MGLDCTYELQFVERKAQFMHGRNAARDEARVLVSYREHREKNVQSIERRPDRSQQLYVHVCAVFFFCAVILNMPCR